MNPTTERERWNLRAEAIERQRDRVLERIYRDPGILIAAFARAGGSWLKTAQILGIGYARFWTDEPPDTQLDHPQTITETQKLADRIAPQLLYQ